MIPGPSAIPGGKGNGESRLLQEEFQLVV